MQSGAADLESRNRASGKDAVFGFDNENAYVIIEEKTLQALLDNCQEFLYSYSPVERTPDGRQSPTQSQSVEMRARVGEGSGQL